MAKKTLGITLYLSELLYDVQNKTYLTGRSRITKDNYKEVAYMQANEDEENENQILRSFGNALSNLKTKLSEYINADEIDNASNELMKKTASVQLTLSMPANYNSATTEAISSALHQYLVNIAIGDWFAITNKDDATVYITRAAVNLNELKVAVNKRVRPIRNGNFI